MIIIINANIYHSSKQKLFRESKLKNKKRLADLWPSVWNLNIQATNVKTYHNYVFTMMFYRSQITCSSSDSEVQKLNFKP